MATNRKWVQTKKTQLYTSIGAATTSIQLKNAYRLDGTQLDMEDDFGAIGHMTLEPGGLKEEIISFTGLSYNVSGTILTLTGCTRGLKGESTYGSGGTAYGHSANRIAIFTNNPQHYAGFANKYNTETITEVWTFEYTDRPKLDQDKDALLAEEFITLGQANRLIQTTYIQPVVVSNSQGSTGLVQGQITPFAHVVPTGLSNGGTFVIVHTQEDVTVSSITLGAQNFTQIATETRASSNQRIEIWRLLAPTAGTGNITITTSGNAYSTAQVITLENVNQVSPVDATSTGADGLGTSVTDSITTVTANSVILMGVGGDTDPTTFTETAPLAEILVDDAGTLRPTSTSVRTTTTAGVYNLAYTISPSQDFVTKAIAIKGVTGGGGGDAFTVGATATDTTPNFLDDKIEVVSADSSVTVTKTIQNSGANEKISYDLSVAGGLGGGGTKLAIDTTQFSTNSQIYVDMYSVAIPGGTLGTNDAIRFSVIFSELTVDPTEDLYIKVLYGGQAVVPEFILSQGASGGSPENFSLQGFIVADGATNAQKASAMTNWETGTGNGEVYGSYGTGTVDSTANQNLVIQVRFGSSGNQIVAEAIVVEKITDGATSSEKKVGVGETTDIEWFNIQFPFHPDSDMNNDTWVYNGIVNNSSYCILTATDSVYSNSSGGTITSFLPDFDQTGGILRFQNLKQSIFQVTIRTNNAGVNNFASGVGFELLGNGGWGDSQGDTTTEGVGFVRRDSDGQWYARACSGAATTETAITISDDAHTFRCEYDPGNATPQARFYVDGTLVATITTNLPTAYAGAIGFFAGNGTVGGSVGITLVGVPSFAVEL